MSVQQLVENMHPIVSMSGGIELFAALITLILFVGSCFEPSRKTRIGKMLMGILLSHTIMQATDAMLWFLVDIPAYIPMVRVLNTLSFVSGGILMVLYVYCALTYIEEKEPVSFVPAHIAAVVIGIAVVAWVISNFNGMYYYFDENGLYCNGPLSWVNLVLWYALFLTSVFVVLVHRKVLGWKQTCILISFGILPIAASSLETVWDITPRYMAMALSIILVYMVIHVTQSKQLLQRELELSQSRVAIMLSQIQPHFLYNALGAIEQLCVVDPPTAKQAMNNFSHFLRGNLDSLTADKPISFEQELQHTEHYLAIEKLRFQQYLNIEYHIETALFRLPTLTLQPIVENAVRYGVTKKDEGGTVTITAKETDTAFIVTVVDDGVGFDPMLPHEDGRTHIGIQNVRTRLASMVNGTLDIQSTPGVGTVATITIPKEEN
ncbi:MAG: histidine kinase [Anaerostipes sp.]|nr:histidine kinase [Anaerostipes sp.]